MDTAKPAISNQPPAPVSLGEAFRYWLKLGFVSFGGPTGQIAIMHQDLVERKRWISEKRFLHALNYCMVLPGPEAQQLATYIGWMMHRTWGGVISGGLFVLPSLFILAALTWVYLAYGNVPLVAFRPRPCDFPRDLARGARRARRLVRVGQRALANGMVLHQGGAAHLRRRVRGAALRLPGRGRALPVADRNADDRLARARGDNAGTAYHGGRLRRLCRRLDESGARSGGAGARGLFRRGRGNLIHVPAVLPLHSPRRPAGGIDARESAVHRTAHGNHRRGGRRDSQSRGVLRLARVLAGRFLGPLRVVFRAHRPRGDRCAVALQERDDPGDPRLRRGGPRVPSLPGLGRLKKRAPAGALSAESDRCGLFPSDLGHGPSDALVLAIVSHRLVLELGEQIRVFLRRFVRLRLGFGGLGRIGRCRGQLRPDRARGRSHRNSHDHNADVHIGLLLQCWTCGATGVPSAVPALIFPDFTSLYQYSWCSLAQASST